MFCFGEQIMLKRTLTKRKTKRVSAWFLVALCILALSAGLTGCGSTTGHTSTPTGSNTLRVGVRANVSKFGHLNVNSGRYSGLEIDIAEEMASRLGYTEIEYVTATPATKEELLLNDEVDCVIACYSITSERAEDFDFSPTYYEDNSVCMIQYSSCFSNIREMIGCTFGTVTESNTTQELIDKLTSIGFTDGEILYVSEDDTYYELDNLKIQEMDTYQELSDALDAGTIDAMCADGAIINSFMDDSRRIMNFYISSQDYGVATVKGSALSEPVYQTIEEMLNDGTIDMLIDKWD